MGEGQQQKEILVIPSNNIREEAAKILADSIILNTNYDPTVHEKSEIQ